MTPFREGRARRARHRPRVARALLVAMAAWLLLPSGSARAEGALSDAEIRQRARAVLADPSYQTTPPKEMGAPAAYDPPPPRDFDLPLRVPRTTFKTGSGGSPSGVSEALLWVLGIGAGVAVLAVIVSAAMRWQRVRKTKPEAVTQGPIGSADPALEALPASLREARARAAAGRFEEAVHVLLRGALDYLRGRSGFTLAAALTSREVLAEAPIEDDTRGAFGDLVSSVEVSLFGGFPVSAADFERCASSFEVVHRRLGGGA
jgi:hypothetical protein